MILVIGGANSDVKARSSAAAVPRTSNPGVVRTTAGGVGRNVAENLARLGSPVALVSVVGADAAGDDLLAATAEAGVDISRVRRGAEPTGTYVAVLDADGELVTAVADMAATATLAPDDLTADVLDGVDLAVLDGNLRPDTLRGALDLCAAAEVQVVLDPVSVPKAALVRSELSFARPIMTATPNVDEAEALGGVAALHSRGVKLVWVRRGPAGSTMSGPGGAIDIPPVVATQVVDVTGAGDAMLASYCHALLGGAAPHEAAAYGHAAAALTVASPHTVRPDLTDELVRSLL